MRRSIYLYLNSLMPSYPLYVTKDWLYGFAKYEPHNKQGIIECVTSVGLNQHTEWQLVNDMKFTPDMWAPDTKQRLEARDGGKSNPYKIPKDAERHITQAAMAKLQGGVRKEPVIIIEHSNGYELMEGWHRTIQHFNMYPTGFVGPAYVAKSNK